MPTRGYCSRLTVALLLALLAGCVATPGAGPTVRPAETATPAPGGGTCRLLTPTPGEPAGSGAAGTAAVSTAVGPAGTSSLTPAPTQAAPAPAPTLPLTNTALRYRLIERFGDVAFCDPDLYPVAHGDEQERALAWFAQAAPGSEEIRVIVERQGLGQVGTLTSEQQLIVYREHKRLAAIRLEACDIGFAFQFATGDMMITGQVDAQGNIQVVSEKRYKLNCPICLAFGTRIDTPSGPKPVQELEAGMVVWSIDAAGRRVEAAILSTARTPVGAGHLLAHVRLDDGRELWASPGHPTADGRRLGELRPGDILDGGRVVMAATVPYGHDATYDLLPASATGAYWANGVLLGSTLVPGR